MFFQEYVYILIMFLVEITMESLINFPRFSVNYQFYLVNSSGNNDYKLLHNSNNSLLSKESVLNKSVDYLKGYTLKGPEDQQVRTKRGVGHLYNMISCATGCNPLSYKGYGCFCGLFGSGFPVDGIDRCCKMHDWCYDAANCPMYFEYFIPYYWECRFNKPYCALDHGELGAPGSCADKLCECDRELSQCLKKFSCPSQRAFCKSSPFRFLQNAFMWFT